MTPVLKRLGSFVVSIYRCVRIGELCVCEIFEELNVEQANTSQHLAVMKKQDILQSRKEGLKAIYSIKYPEIIESWMFWGKYLSNRLMKI
ncbi:ArsR/SmtB family transcription factor [Desulforamulus hydrothermalis]|uniref:HTH arsR-type domain-containing protein n=1 Tax=Desulforamulus hydrothermalis Lam5 = DSM 18033 TaxID=1121428 RepID=K8DYM1_9FIRM|nr:hypothetical protein DESHY_150108 [Desulforamulus hydrothermalis Lam5 = DSM 18033]